MLPMATQRSRVHCGRRAAVTVVAGIGLGTPLCEAAAQDHLLDADFEEVFRVGGINAPSWAQFSNVTKVAFDESGNLYVLDFQAFHFVVIDRNGGYRRTVGQQGDGPGEFRAVTNLLVWRSGRVGVLDMGRNAIEMFDAQGTYERSIRMAGGGNILAGLIQVTGVMKLHPDGNSVIAQGAPDPMADMFGSIMNVAGAEAPAGLGERGLERLVFSGDTVVAETILQAWTPPREAAGAKLLEDDLNNPSMVFQQLVGQETMYEPEPANDSGTRGAWV